MCGIVGIRRFDGLPADEALLRTMARELAHRGPDGEGHWTDGPVGFGHKRLAIIDLAGPPQPLASADGSSHVTFNGEILNYRQLREEIPYPYQTQGDTEVLLAVFRAHGAEGVRHLRGQFAYALHDARDGRLWLFRDRLGILPLYYYIDDRVLLFASEVKALLPALPTRLEVDHGSLGDYLTGRSVPAPSTLFLGIRKVPPAHYLRVDPDGQCAAVRYWSFPAPVDSQPPTASAIAEIDAALNDAVSDATVADVPVGAYLSGGLDSSLIVALLARQNGSDNVETFTAGFGSSASDEVPIAHRLSRWLGVRNHHVPVRPTDFSELWPKLTWHRDAPLSEPADVAVYRLAEAAREKVKVILSGEGSDELFAGYPKYRAASLAAAASSVPLAVRRPVVGAARRVVPGSRRAQVALQVLSAPAAGQVSAWFSPFSEDERTSLLGSQPRGWQPEVVGSASGDPIRRMLYVDCHAWLADNLLERGDRMSMAASLELRPPFLDHRLVEAAFALPSSMKVRRGRGKWIVKEVASRYLPEENVHRRKVGFKVPLQEWFRSELRDLAWDRLLDRESFAARTFDRPTLAALLQRHDRGSHDEHLAIWTLLSLEVWHEVFFRPRQTVPHSS